MIEGHCLCGAVTVRAGRNESWMGACHCRMCQRWSGGLFLCFPAGEIAVEGPVTRFQSSDFAERAFCAVCGTHLWMRNTLGDGTGYDLMPGLFDEARDWPLRSEVYSDRAFAALKLAGDHRRATREEYEKKNLFVEGDAP